MRIGAEPKQRGRAVLSMLQSVKQLISKGKIGQRKENFKIASTLQLLISSMALDTPSLCINNLPSSYGSHVR